MFLDGTAALDRVLKHDWRGFSDPIPSILGSRTRWWQAIPGWEDVVATRWLKFALLQEDEFRPRAGVVATYSAAINLTEIREAFEAQDWPAVERFISSAPWLEPLVMELVQPARAAFGARTKIWLSLLEDPDGGYSQLMATIEANLPIEDRLARLAQLDAAWWMEASTRSRDRLIVSI